MHKVVGTAFVTTMDTCGFMYGLLSELEHTVEPIDFEAQN